MVTVRTRKRGGESRRETFRDGGLITIGRSPDNDVMLLCPRVSKHHATAQVTGGVVVLRDLASMNGTFVNGVQVRSQATLTHGDLVQIGDFVLSFDPGRPEPPAPAEVDEPTSTGLEPSLGEAIARERRLAGSLTRRLRAEGLSREAMLRVVDAMVDLLAAPGDDPHENH